ncbi:hypothetical protein H2508_09730 [Parahaliea sp. F7430]|uniref:Lipoprotein n=1 Tax=Sediminihaliea albiluteola TaxID=2758564 RepID=A0A7W2YK75_9GAMM|nr:hypothetical protein [Sediminihaliea albiluteola]MBA6413389.1 hypothetical protein [Sediminihaliea albiluteola]
MIMVRQKAIALVIAAVLGLGACSSPGPSPETVESGAQLSGASLSFGKNASFTLDGTLIELVNGVSSEPIANSSSRTTTRYLGGEAVGDLNGDGLEDFSFWVAQNAGGSGTFYYVVVALKRPSGYTTTNAFFVGDRIVPETMQISRGSQELQVNFNERARGEPMSTLPSKPATLLLKVTPDGVLEGLMK